MRMGKMPTIWESISRRRSRRSMSMARIAIMTMTRLLLPWNTFMGLIVIIKSSFVFFCLYRCHNYPNASTHCIVHLSDINIWRFIVATLENCFVFSWHFLWNEYLSGVCHLKKRKLNEVEFSAPFIHSCGTPGWLNPFYCRITTPKQVHCDCCFAFLFIMSFLISHRLL